MTALAEASLRADERVLLQRCSLSPAHESP
jgi:hypothetical protein